MTIVRTTSDKYIKYPISAENGWLEKAICRLGFGGIAKCPVCGSLTFIVQVEENLRESCYCKKCGATNRQRQIAYVICDRVGSSVGRRLASLSRLRDLPDFAIYNTEAQGSIHERLTGAPQYVGSEYLGERHSSGDIVNGVMHQDLMALSFPDESFDLVISSDVFEHVAEPYQAHQEVFRVLRHGGRHIFTVPFYQTDFLDEYRTGVDEEGRIVHLKDPVYHGDPVRSEGALVHTIFSLEMLVELRRLGFLPRMFHLHRPAYGIVGANAVVFEALKE